MFYYFMYYCLIYFVLYSMFILLYEYCVISEYLVGDRIFDNKWEKIIRVIVRSVIQFSKDFCYLINYYKFVYYFVDLVGWYIFVLCSVVWVYL